MDGRRFDALARVAVSVRSRRGVLRVLAGAILAGIRADAAAGRCVHLGRRCGPGDRCCRGNRCRRGRCRCARGTGPRGGGGDSCCARTFICCEDRFCCNPQTPTCCPRNRAADPPEAEDHCCPDGAVCCSERGGRGCCGADAPFCCPANEFPTGACCPVGSPICCGPNAAFPQGFCCPVGFGCGAGGCARSGTTTGAAGDEVVPAVPVPGAAGSLPVAPDRPKGG